MLRQGCSAAVQAEKKGINRSPARHATPFCSRCAGPVARTVSVRRMPQAREGKTAVSPVKSPSVRRPPAPSTTGPAKRGRRHKHNGREIIGTARGTQARRAFSGKGNRRFSAAARRVTVPVGTLEKSKTRLVRSRAYATTQCLRPNVQRAAPQQAGTMVSLFRGESRRERPAACRDKAATTAYGSSRLHGIDNKPPPLGRRYRAAGGHEGRGRTHMGGANQALTRAPVAARYATR